MVHDGLAHATLAGPKAGARSRHGGGSEGGLYRRSRGARRSGSEYSFTQFQAPGMPDDVFQKNVKAIEHELTVLKAIAEVECPL